MARNRIFDGQQLVAEGGTQLVRDPFGGVLAELDRVKQGNGNNAIWVTRQQEVLTDVLGSTVAVAVDGVIDADLALYGDFGELLTDPEWDTATGFTGKVETAGLTEFVTRAYDADARVWVSDDAYRGQAVRASSMNRYAYVEGAPETFVDHLGFFRAAAALEAQRLAAAEAAWLAAIGAWVRAQPLCGGYYGCAQSKTYEQQYRDAYAAASQAVARNAWSQQAIDNYTTQANYEYARMNWNEQTIASARENYAVASLNYAKENWNDQSIASLKRLVDDYNRAVIEANVAGLYAQAPGGDPNAVHEDRGWLGNQWETTKGWLGAAWDTVLTTGSLALAFASPTLVVSTMANPNPLTQRAHDAMWSFGAGVEENGWWVQLNMALNPVYAVANGAVGYSDAMSIGDYHSAGGAGFEFTMGVVGTAAVAIPFAKAVVPRAPVAAVPKSVAAPTAAIAPGAELRLPLASIESAVFSRKTASPFFSAEGTFLGTPVDDVAAALAKGWLLPADVPVMVIVRDGNTLIVNTRSAVALETAGIPRSLWKVEDVTGNPIFEDAISARLTKNGLGSDGIQQVRTTGGGL